MDTFGQRLRAERERLGFTQPQWGAIVGVEKNAQGNYEAEKRSPDANYLIAAAKAGADVAFLITGERSEASLPLTSSSVSSRIERQSLADALGVGQTDLVMVPLFKAQLMAGLGHDNTDATLIETLGFPRNWLRSVGVSPSGAVLAFAKGESMRPTIMDGDILLIDRHAAAMPLPRRSLDDRRPALIYALHDDNGARVKRIVSTSGETVVLLSDNPDFPPEIREASSIEITGRVLWWGHTAA